MDIANWIEKWADFSPRKTAIRFEGAEISYADLAGQIARLAAVLKNELGVSRGQRIAHLGFNSPGMLVLLFACARLGAIMVPLNWRLAAAEHLYILKHSGARCLFADHAFLDHIEPIKPNLGKLDYLCPDNAAPRRGWTAVEELLADSQGDSPAPSSQDLPLLIVYTSGTTGRPKGAILTQAALQWNAINSTIAHDMTSSDHILNTLPMFHVGGLNIQTTPALHAGATVTLHRVFDVDATMHALTVDRPTLAVLVPAQISALSQHAGWDDADFSSLRVLTTGSSIVPKPLIEVWHDKGIPVMQVYGSTETAPIAIHQRASDAMATVGSAGKPAVHCQVRLVDEQGRDIGDGDRGEILVRGPNVMTGYWDDAEATKLALREGWHYTGDIAYRDKDGYYYVVERKSDMIISGGENIYPAEIEAVLHEHGDIVEAAVVGRKHEKWGEVAVAVVVARPDSGLAEAQILALFDGSLARYKHPKAVIMTDALPRNAMGKILKYKIRDMIERGALA